LYFEGETRRGVVVQAIIAAAIAALPLLFGASLVPALAMIVLAAIIAYCRWWLYDRLICLNGDVCAVGMLLSVETPDQKSGLDAFDTDYSLNLVLPPTEIGATQADVEKSPEGVLVSPQQGLDTPGHTAQRWQNQPLTAVLHAEFEGAGVYDLLVACLAAFAFATAATAVCSIPIFGFVACLILLLIAAAITVAGVIIALNDKANPTDVNSNLADLHQLDPTGLADIVVVQGTWVYDSAHEGWNEIHPIKQCQIIGKWFNSWNSAPEFVPPPGTNTLPLVEQWCSMIADANSPGTKDNQTQPQNQWQIHPDIDGCEPGGSPPPPPPR
jgi:hypothetical protein